MVTAETIRQALRCGVAGCKCGTSKTDVHCPVHNSDKANFSVSEAEDGKPLVHCHVGCSQEQAVEALKARGLWPSSNSGRPPKFNILKTYDYQDASGKMVYQVARLDPKDFRQRQPDPQNPDKWIWKMAGVKYLPYRLPELVKAKTVFINEGEKDCDRLRSLDLTATTNAGGAGKWRKEYNQHFKGKAVVILPDNDDPGRAHAQDVARNLHGIAASVKVVELPGLPEKGDVSDWLAAGGTVEKLAALVEGIPEWTAQGAQVAQEDKPKPTQAELLIKLAADAELFHDMNRKGYATIPVAGHVETWPIKSIAFRDWLRGRFYKAHGKPPGGQALQDALDLLAAQARFDGQEREIYVRVAHMNGKVYVDLANESWQAVEITSQGWRVVARPPVKFKRPRGLAPMPTPEPGGNLADLKPFINCRDEDWPLVVAWIIGAFSPGPYPIMIFQGEQGTAKSTTARALKNVLDPGHSPQRTAPRNVQDLMISASNSWSLSFDNLSNLSPWLSDGFCRLATGGGLSTRELYSDDNETILDAMRPVILNGIDSLVSRADLADRAILLELPQIKTNHRRHEADLWKAFEAAQPGILGAVFKALSVALANVHKVKLAQLPRMADFAIWVVAGEPALPWEPGTFLDVYSGNRAAVMEHSLEGDVVAVAVRSFMADGETWEGAPSALLEALEAITPESTIRSKAWPKAANSLSNRLRRAATFLRATGIEIERGKSGSKNRTITIYRTVGVKDRPDRPDRPLSNDNNNLHGDDPGDDPKKRDDPTVPRDDPQKRPSPRKATDREGWDDGDDGDDKKPSFPKTDANGQPLGEVEL